MAKFTAICVDIDGGGSAWVSAVDAETVDQAKDVARRECAEAWDYDESRIHCLGIFEGDCNLLHWQDLEDI